MDEMSQKFAGLKSKLADVIAALEARLDAAREMQKLLDEVPASGLPTPAQMVSVIQLMRRVEEIPSAGRQS